MSEDIPFNRTLRLGPGVIDHVAPGVRRILVDNPGPFTFKGTLSYIIGRGRVAIITGAATGLGEAQARGGILL